MNRYIALQKAVELESLTKAAETLGYTQSAMSQMITSLEDEFSIKLVNRFRTGTKLTPEGAELYPLIDALVNQHRAIREKTAEIKGLGSGIVRIGAFSSISTQWFPALLKEFQALYPNVEFVIHQGDYKTHEEMIRTGAVDFAFVQEGQCGDLETLTLKEGIMLAVLPMEHPLSTLDTIPLQALTTDPFILLEEGAHYETLDAFRALGLQPNVKYVMHDDYAIMAMVEQGLGVSMLAELVTRNTNREIDLRPTEPLITRKLTIGYRNKASLSMASRRFLRCMQDHLEILP